MDQPQPRPRTTSWGRTWRIVGVALVALALVGGLVWFGFMLLIVLAFSSYGSNK